VTDLHIAGSSAYGREQVWVVRARG